MTGTWDGLGTSTTSTGPGTGTRPGARTGRGPEARTRADLPAGGTDPDLPAHRDPHAHADLDAAPDAAADPEQVARAICLGQLSAAPRSRAELARALARSRVPEAAAQRVLDRLTEVGLIDDVAYAEAWVRSRHAGRGLARRALARELHQRGVDADVTAAAVEALDPEQERSTARRLAERKLRTCVGLDPSVRLRRVAAVLARKGYPPALSLSVVRAALAAEDGSSSGFGSDSGLGPRFHPDPDPDPDSGSGSGFGWDSGAGSGSPDVS